MKRILLSVLLISCVFLFCACGQNSEYKEIVTEIGESEYAYDIIKPYLNDTEALSYILKKMAPEDISKLFVQDLSTYYGTATAEHVTEIGEKILKVMADEGFENFPRDSVLKALERYLPSTPGYNKDSLAALKELEGDEFYTAATDEFSRSSSAADAEDVLFNEAYKRAKKQLVDSLKNPGSYKEVSLIGSTVEYDPETGEYVAIVVITYTATNSFGAELQDTYTYTETGTYIDGIIKYY